MKISVENLGTIHKGEISLDKELTIFTGENNSGKSYMSYLVYGVLKILDSSDDAINIIEEYAQELKLSSNLTNGIKVNFEEINSKIFNFFEDRFNSKDNTSILVEMAFKGLQGKFLYKIEYLKLFYIAWLKNYFRDLNDKEITFESIKYNIKFDGTSIIITTTKYNDFLKNIIRFITYLFFNRIGLLKMYFVPAERTAINMFYNEVVGNQAEKHRKKELYTPFAPIAIEDYVFFAYDFRKHVLNPPTIFADLATELENLLGGGVGVSAFGDLQFQPTKEASQIPLYLTSSLVKSWSGVVIYLRHLAQEGDVLMIDEPEINLHPKTQVQIARFLAKMVNRGIRIVVSTHSDYILRELSTLIILNRDFEGKTDLLQRYAYQENSTLSGDKVAVYHFGNHTITNIPITNKGIETDSIDEVISQQNEVSDMVYYSYLDTLPEEE